MAAPVGLYEDRDAFADFHAAYERRVRGLARHLLGNDAAVDDVVQETLWRAYRKGLHDGDGREPWPWLATVTRNACHDVHRSRRATTAVEDWEQDEQQTAPDAETFVVDDARRSYVEDALDRLPPRQRRLLVLRHVEGVRCDAIAADEESTTDAVKSALARARGAFRSRYEGWRGMFPWLAPLLTRARDTAASITRSIPGLRSDLGRAVAGVLALGLLAGSASGLEPASPAEPVAPVGASPADDGWLSDLPQYIAEVSSARWVAAPPPQTPSEGGDRVVSPPPTPADAGPTLGSGPVSTTPAAEDDPVGDLVREVEAVDTLTETANDAVADVADGVDDVTGAVTGAAGTPVDADATGLDDSLADDVDTLL